MFRSGQGNHLTKGWPGGGTAAFGFVYELSDYFIAVLRGMLPQGPDLGRNRKVNILTVLTLVAAIISYRPKFNEEGHRCHWTKSAEAIITSVKKLDRTLGNATPADMLQERRYPSAQKGGVKAPTIPKRKHYHQTLKELNHPS